MKRLLLAVLTILVMAPIAKAGDKNKKPEQQVANAKQEENEIQWMSIDEVQAKMRQAPRKVFMDMYTDWCGWCKRMDATTFHNPNVVKYMNEKFYCVKFNAERKDTIRFMSKYYSFDPSIKANTLAAEFMRNQMSYPTGVFLEERFQNPIPVPGYQEVRTWEMIVKYIGENVYRTQKFEDYQKTFTSAWDATPVSQEATPPKATSDEPPVMH